MFAICRARPLFSFQLVLFASVCFSAFQSEACGQFSVLSRGNVDAKWRETQLATINQQLEATDLGQAIRRELMAQAKWLEAWRPGKLTVEPLWQDEEQGKPLIEPVIDPNRLAGKLRQKLLDENAKPSPKDTQALKDLLADHPEDPGVRQLHLHWLDQIQYRKLYPDEIADAASRLATLLESLADSEQTRLAVAFCLYRRGRALAYRELPDVVEEKPLEDPEAHEAQLLGTYRQLKAIVPQNCPEFVLLDIRMLRRDNFHGQALEQLEDFGSQLSPKWYLKKRRDLLRELGWEIPAKEAAKIYAAEFPEEVANEQAAP